MQCFNIAFREPLTQHEAATVAWLLRETYQPTLCSSTSQLDGTSAGSATSNGTGSGSGGGEGHTCIIEVGPRLTFSTAWSANAVSACEACGIHKITRLERSWRYAVRAAAPLSEEQRERFAALVHDRMTEQVYPQPLQTFQVRFARLRVCCLPLRSLFASMSRCLGRARRQSRRKRWAIRVGVAARRQK